jgi:HTH-type transcriptional regulator/antitoxin HigA
MTMNAISFDYTDTLTQHEFHLPLSAFKKPINDKEYVALETILNQLIDEVRDDETHPLALAMEIIGDNLEQYDSENNIPIGQNITDIEMVSYLMEKNNLHQKDLADIFGGQPNVSKFLKGERPLGKNHIIGLSQYFKINASFFLN